MQSRFREFHRFLSAEYPPPAAGALPTAAAAAAIAAPAMEELEEPEPPLYEREPPAARWQPEGYVPGIRKEGGGTKRKIH